MGTNVSNDNKPEKLIGNFYEEITWWRKHVSKRKTKIDLLVCYKI